MQRRDHSKKMRAGDNCDDRDQILLRSSAIEEHNGNNDRQDLERHKDSINFSVEAAASCPNRNGHRRDDNRA